MIDGKCIRSGGCPFDCDDKTCLVPKSQVGAFTLDWPISSSYGSTALVEAEARILSGTEDWLSGTEDWPDLHCTVIHDSIVYEIGPSDAHEQVLQAILSKLMTDSDSLCFYPINNTTTPTTEE